MSSARKRSGSCAVCRGRELGGAGRSALYPCVRPTPCTSPTRALSRVEPLSGTPRGKAGSSRIVLSVPHPGASRGTALTEESAPRRRGSGRSPQELEEAEEDPPPDPPEAAALLALRPESRFWSPGLREDKESPNLWQFATAAPGSKCILGERSALRNM